MRFNLIVTDSGPLSLRPRRETTTAETRSYVPGATVLGALAAAHAQYRGAPGEFDAFFGPQCRFSNLYPAAFAKDDLGNDDAAPVYPLPATAVSCKRFGGFHFDQVDDGEPHHGVHDTLIAGTMFALAKETRPALLSRYEHCEDPSGCHEPMDRFEGFYRRESHDARRIGRAQVRRGLRTRTGISRATGAVARGILYSREVLNAGTAYWGTAEVPDAAAAAFAAFVSEMSEAGLIRFGNNRTRGFGLARVSARRPVGAGESVQSLQARVKAFDAQVRERARLERIETAHALYVAITLTADAIVLDRLLRYRGQIDGAYLEQEWGIAGATCLYQHTAGRRIMGWNQVLGVPKPEEAAIAMGSVFVFGIDRALDATLAGKLLALQNQGMGMRRREGYGQLVVASPFHYEVRGL